MTFTMDEGEYLRVQVSYEGSDAPWDDLTGCTVSMTAAVDYDAAPIFTVAGTLDAAGPDGLIHSCGAVVPRETPVGYYVGTLTITKVEDEQVADGYPQPEPFFLVVKAVA
jgi:hypothetical protein